MAGGACLWGCLGAGTVSTEVTTAAAQLGWVGHLGRMPDDWLPEAVFWGELVYGVGRMGAPGLGCRDCLKWHLKNAGIDVDTWKDKAHDRSHWHGIIFKSLITIEDRHLQRYNIAHDKRHSQPVTSDFICSRCH